MGDSGGTIRVIAEIWRLEAAMCEALRHFETGGLRGSRLIGLAESDGQLQVISEGHPWHRSWMMDDSVIDDRS